MAHDGDLALDASGDLDVQGSDLVIVRGTDSITSDLRARLQFFRGEWFLDRDAGLPYFTDILGVKSPNLQAIRAIFEAEIRETPGVTELLSLELDFDTEDRTLDVSWRVRADAGELIEGAQEIDIQ